MSQICITITIHNLTSEGIENVIISDDGDLDILVEDLMLDEEGQIFSDKCWLVVRGIVGVRSQNKRIADSEDEILVFDEGLVESLNLTDIDDRGT